jgi:tetratricopeptide (TPR) repeat protein
MPNVSKIIAALFSVLLAGTVSVYSAGPTTSPPFSLTAPPPPTLERADSLLVLQNYPAAKNFLTEYLKNSPGSNEALYLSLAVDQTEILDYESYSMQNERFIKSADSVKAILEARLKKLHGKDSILCLFYIANICGGVGVIQGKVGNWFSAVKSSMSSISMLKEVAKLDTTMVAAYLGIGIFHYYLSKSFKWLPFIDEKSEEEGIRDVERATRAPYPFGFAAKNSLCWILIERQNYRRADSIAASVLADAPDNSIFLRIHCLIALWSKRYDDAVAIAQKISNLSLSRTPVNWSDLVLGQFALTSSYDAQGKTNEAVAAADYILKAPIPAGFLDVPHIKKNIKKVQAIRKKYKTP